MTVKELIEELQTLPPDAIVHVWNGEYAESEPITQGAFQPNGEYYKSGDGAILIA